MSSSECDPLELPGPGQQGAPQIIRAELARVVTALEAMGWCVAHADAGATPPAAFAVLADALDFPAHFGGNLDALWDCLTELRVPTALVWTGWQKLADDAPQRWAQIVEVLADRCHDDAPGTVPFAVFLISM